MRTQTRNLPIPVLLAMAAVAQQLPAETKVLSFRHTESVQSMQEIATAIRSVAMVDDLLVDGAKRTLSLTANSGTMALAEWMLSEWDRPVTAPQLDAQGQDPVSHEYRIAGAPDEYVRIFYLTHDQTVPELQEAATCVRAIGEIRQLFTYSGQRAIALRASASQVALSDWLVRQLNRPVASAPPKPNEFKAGTGVEDLVHIFFVRKAETAKDLQALAVHTRTSTQVRRLFTYNAHRAIVLKGTADQVAQAQELLRAAE